MTSYRFFLSALFIALLPSFLISCSSKENKDLLISINESLNSTNGRIKNSSVVILKSLEDKATDPISRERASVWYPKARKIESLSNNILHYTSSVIQKGEFGRDSINSLFKLLGIYKRELLLIDSSINQEFSNKIVLIPNLSETVDDSSGEFFNTYFRKSTKTESSLLLNTIKSNILVVENDILQFCHTRTTYYRHYDEFYSVLLGQNKSQLKAGEVLEISGGIGTFSWSAQPRVKVAGVQVPLTDGSFLLYKKTVSSKPGKYKLPVTFSYFNKITGYDETRAIDIEYTVIKPCHDQ